MADLNQALAVQAAPSGTPDEAPVWPYDVSVAMLSDWPLTASAELNTAPPCNTRSLAAPSEPPLAVTPSNE